MKKPRAVTVILLICLVLSLSLNSVQLIKYNSLVKQAGNDIRTNLTGLCYIADSFKEGSSTGYNEQEQSRKLITAIDSYTQLKNGGKYYNLRNIAKSYEALYGLSMSYSDAEPIMVLNSKLYEYISILIPGNARFKELQRMDEPKRSREEKADFEKGLKALDEKIKSEDSAEDPDTGYRLETLNANIWYINHNLQPLLEAEYEDYGG